MSNILSSNTITVEGLNYTINTTTETASVISAVNTEMISCVVPATITYEGATYLVTNIGPAAFQNYKNMSSIILPEGIISISDNAFNSVISLGEIVIPSTVTTLGNSVFRGSISLRAVTYLGNMPTLVGESIYSDTFGNLTSYYYSNTQGWGTQGSKWHFRDLVGIIPITQPTISPLIGELD